MLSYIISRFQVTCSETHFIHAFYISILYGTDFLGSETTKSQSKPPLWEPQISYFIWNFSLPIRVIWILQHSMNVMKVKADSDREDHLMSSGNANQPTIVKQENLPQLTTFPAIKSEVKVRRFWDAVVMGPFFLHQYILPVLVMQLLIFWHTLVPSTEASIPLLDNF